MRRHKTAVLGLTAVLLGQASCAGNGDPAPPPLILKAAPAASMAGVAGTPCPRMTLHDFTPVQTAAATEALEAACRVIGSPSFRAEVTGKDWLSGCRLLPFGKPYRVRGAEVYRLLEAGVPDFKLVAAKVGGPSTVAVTSVVHSTITIMPSRFEGWTGGTKAGRAALVDTLVHEMTHLIPEEGTTDRFRFTDNFHGTWWCRDENLVSYGLGQAAGRLWRAEQA